MQNIAENFSKALRRECAFRGSIAEVCRGTGINRQQFNKYLSGQIMPSARTLQKICAFLGIAAETLLQHGEPGGVSAPAAIDLSRPPRFEAFRTGGPPAHVWRRQANVLPNGHYDCYVLLQPASGLVVRWLLTVKAAGSGQVFVARAWSGAGAARPMAYFKHHGDVRRIGREYCLVVRGEMPRNQPGIVVVGTVPVAGDSYFSGIALTPRASGTVAVAVTLHLRGTGRSPRERLAGIGICRLADPALDPTAARLIQATPSAGANWMQSVGARKLRAAMPAGHRDPARVPMIDAPAC